MHATPAIILKREDFRERDESIIFYTKYFGKLSVIAKGTRRIEAKLRGGLDTFNISDIIFVEGSKFPILTSVDTHKRFSNIGRSTHAYKSSLSASEIIIDIFEERLPDLNIFSELYIFLEKLDKCVDAKDSWALLKNFQIKILENQGYSFQNSNDNPSSIEELLVRAYEANFNYKIHSWLPSF